MLQQLLQQFCIFSRENWWVYILLLFCLGLIFFTWKGSLIEVLLLFLINLFGNICMMIMQDSYSKQQFRVGSTFLLISNILFLGIALYSFFFNGEKQYVYWQISFILWGMRSFLQYNFSRSFWFLSGITVGIINVCILSYILLFLDFPWYGIIQSFGFAIITYGLILLNDIHRYIYHLLGTTILVIGSVSGLYVNYVSGTIFWITVSYSVLSLTVLSFYMKVLPSYISRIKKL
jgi:hypothetical protein